VLDNLTEGMILVVIVLFLFLGNVRGAIIVALTIPFALLFAAMFLNLKGIPANLLSIGALDFGMLVDGSVVIVENIVRHFGLPENSNKTPIQRIQFAVIEVIRPVFYARAIIITAYLPIFTLQSVEGRLFKPMAWTVSFALLGALLFSMQVAPVLASLLLSKGGARVAQPRDGILENELSRSSQMGDRPSPCNGWRGSYRIDRCRLSYGGWGDRLGVPTPPG